jgi:hypothetical protein
MSDASENLANNKALVRRFWEAFSRSDFDTVMDLLADDVSWWVAGSTGISGTYDKAGLKELFTNVAGGTKTGVRVTPTVMTAEEDRVAMEALSEAETLDGKIYKNDYHFQHVIKDGKLAVVREYMDPEHVREVFGV